MKNGLNGRRLKELWVENTYNLAETPQYEVIGKITTDSLKQHFPETVLFRPHDPLPPQQGRQLAENLPLPLRKLYKKASKNMREIGINPDECSLYILYQTGIVPPQNCLRADFWHFDLMRNLRMRRKEGEMAVSIGYSISNILPTIYVTKIPSQDNELVLARETVAKTDIHHTLGEMAFQKGDVISSEPGEIVRYDSLVLHRGRPNLTDQSIHRVFMNLTFAPAQP